MCVKMKVRRVSMEAIGPSYAREGDAGLDLCAVEEAELAPGGAALVRTGIAIELPAGPEGQLRPLSGLALKNGVTILNAPGTIDEGYRGEIGVILVNHGGMPFRVRPRMRIEQLVVARRMAVDIVYVDELTDSERGARGFGSTGSVRAGGGGKASGTGAERPVERRGGPERDEICSAAAVRADEGTSPWPANWSTKPAPARRASPGARVSLGFS